MENENEGTLKWPDWFVIGLMLAISSIVGIYYRFTGGRQQTTGEYFCADRSTGSVLIGVAMMVSFVSGPTLLGLSGEVYTVGIQYNLAYVGMMIAAIVVGQIYLPVFYELNTVSMFEYLERRFGKLTRLFGSTIWFGKFILYTGVVIVAPSLALQATTGLNMTFSILLNGLICIFYSTIGGIKAVITTDVMQASFMLSGTLAIVIVCLNKIEGGLWTVLKTAYETDRLTLLTYDLDPTVRYNWLNLLSGGSLIFMYQYGANQVQIQRLLTARTIREARLGMLLNVPLTLILTTTISLAGITLYTYWKQCDVVLSGQINKYDMVMPYFSKQHLSQIPGLTGVFVSGIFSASFSTVSAGFNSLAAMALTDYVKPLIKLFGHEMTDKKAALVGKFLTVTVGCLSLIIAYVASKLDNLLHICLAIYGGIGTPILGLFTLGICFETPNEIGSIIGTSIALVLTLYSALSPKPKPTFLPISIDGCDNATIIAPPPIMSSSNQTLFYLNRVSHMWYPIIGFGSTIIFGLITSAIINCFLNKKEHNLDANLFTPFVADRIKRRREKIIKNNNHNLFILEASTLPKTN